MLIRITLTINATIYLRNGCNHRTSCALEESNQPNKSRPLIGALGIDTGGGVPRTGCDAGCADGVEIGAGCSGPVVEVVGRGVVGVRLVFAR